MDTALTGGQVLEGVAARHLLVRPALRSRGGDPNLAAGEPMKRIERQGVDDTGNRIGRALTGRPSGLPVCRRPVEGVSPGIHCCITPLHIRSMRLSLPQGGWQFRRAVACMTWGQHLDTRTRIIDSNHGHERPVRELRVLLWDILCVLVDISTRTPYCSTVCLCLNNSLTHSLTGPSVTLCAIDRVRDSQTHP